MSSLEFDIDSKSTLRWSDIQLGMVYASVFGALCCWGAHNIYASFFGWRKSPKMIFLLNFLQTVALFVKTVSATVYATYFNLNCEARGALVNIPLLVSWDLIYIMMIFKIMIFTERKKMVIGLFVLGILAHISVIISGVALRTSSMTSSWTCKDVYPLVYKQQYVVEIILEILTVLFLFDGLLSKQQGTMFVQTNVIFNQLKSNEELRIFGAMIFIVFKVALSYSKPPFDTRALTHFIDSCRSATVCWAILREPKTVRRAVDKSKDTQASNSIASKSRFAASPGNILTSFGPIEEAEFEDGGSFTFGRASGTNDFEGIDIPLTSVDTLGDRGHDAKDI